MTEESDQDLLVRCRAGDRAAYAELYQRHSAAAHRFATTLAGDPVRAGDLVSEAFIKIMALLDDGRGPESNFGSYLLTTLRNVMVDDIRRHRREDLVEDMTTVTDADHVVPDHAQNQAETTVVNRAFAKLPERWRDVLWYTEVLKEPMDTVAARFGIKRNAVGVLAWRAREGFRQSYLAEHLAASADPDCVKLAPQIPQYVRGQVTPIRAAELEGHLRTCHSCSAAIGDLESINSNLGALLAPVGLVMVTGGSTVPLAAAGLFKSLTHAIGPKVAGALGVAAATTAAVLVLNHSASTPVADTPVSAAPESAAPTPVEPATPAPRTSRPSPKAAVRTSESPKPAPTAAPTTARPVKPAPVQQTPTPVVAAPELELLQPDVATTRTGQTTTARVVSLAGPGEGARSLAIAIKNASGFTFVSGGWTCRERATSKDVVDVACTTRRGGAESLPIQFSVAAVDSRMPISGSMSLSDARSTITKGFTVQPSAWGR